MILENEFLMVYNISLYITKPHLLEYFKIQNRVHIYNGHYYTRQGTLYCTHTTHVYHTKFNFIIVMYLRGAVIGRYAIIKNK